MSNRPFLNQWLVMLWFSLCAATAYGQTKQKIEVTSSKDGSKQPCYVILPADYDSNTNARPILVALHTWSNSVEQENTSWEEACYRRGWIYLFPHFRGPNNHPSACGSEIAQQDILDALTFAKSNYRVDTSQVYLAGVSGGGHMTMLMASRHPEHWTAASAWVGISDLAQWHVKHEKTRYGAMMRACCGGAPGASSAIDHQYTERSPIHFLQHSLRVPLDIAAGIHDGHTGSVPISHSLNAFNVIARTAKARTISPSEMEALSIPKGRLSSPLDSDQVKDKALGRMIYLRRFAAQSRVTIFEGGHEGIAEAAFDWLARFQTNEQGKNVLRNE